MVAMMANVAITECMFRTFGLPSASLTLPTFPPNACSSFFECFTALFALLLCCSAALL